VAQWAQEDVLKELRKGKSRPKKKKGRESSQASHLIRLLQFIPDWSREGTKVLGTQTQPPKNTPAKKKKKKKPNEQDKCKNHSLAIKMMACGHEMHEGEEEMNREREDIPENVERSLA